MSDDLGIFFSFTPIHNIVQLPSYIRRTLNPTARGSRISVNVLVLSSLDRYRPGIIFLCVKLSDDTDGQMYH